MDENLLKKLKNSVKVKDGDIRIYFANYEIRNIDGVIVGFFDTEKSLNPHRVIQSESSEYVTLRDFKNLHDFQNKINQYLKLKTENKK